jgi:hypothetical protein
MFDITKDKWFIRVANEEQAKAVQEWAFDRGFGWAGQKEFRKDFAVWDKKSPAIGFGHFGCDSLGQARAQWWIDSGHKEIKVSFKTVIDEMEFPKVESAQQIKIRELEATVAEAQRQIQELKKEI